MSKEPPPHWGKDSLSSFFQTAHENIFATFHNKKAQFNGFCAIDNVLTKMINHLINPKAHLESLLLCRAQSHFRTAVRLAFSVQIPEAYQIIRVMIEQAAYAFFVHNEYDSNGDSISSELEDSNGNPTRSSIWLRRNKGSKEDKIFNKLFRMRNIIEEIENEDSETGYAYRELYGLSIDYGGHPNPQGILTNLEIIEYEGSKEYRTNFLQGDSLQLDLCLKSCAEGGLVVLSLFEKIFPERFKLLSIDITLKSMKQNIYKIFGRTKTP